MLKGNFHKFELNFESSTYAQAKKWACSSSGHNFAKYFQWESKLRSKQRG